MPAFNPKLRAALRVILPFLILAAVIAGALILNARMHLLISSAVLLLTLLLFIAGYEKKKTGARRLVICAVLVALAAIGRFIPFFKPVAAITIIAGVWLGSESGFFVGSLSAFISDIWVGMGPWTPFQMLAWGSIGLFAGLLSRYLMRNRALLCIYGAAAGIIFSFLMDIWTVLSMSDGFTFALYGAALLTALPHTILYAVSNVVFLLLLARPFGEKLERMRVKYNV